MRRTKTGPRMPRLVRPILFGGLFIGMIILASLLAFGVSLERQLRCDRQANTCTYTSFFLGRTRREHQPLGSIAAAFSRAGALPGSGYNVWLGQSYGKWFLGRYSTNDDAETVVRKINQFERARESPPLVIAYSFVTGYWLLWGSVPVFGYLLVELLSGIVGGPSPFHPRRSSG
jgi:hypothetical protein